MWSANYGGAPGRKISPSHTVHLEMFPDNLLRLRSYELKNMSWHVIDIYLVAQFLRNQTSYEIFIIFLSSKLKWQSPFHNDIQDCIQSGAGQSLRSLPGCNSKIAQRTSQSFWLYISQPILACVWAKMKRLQPSPASGENRRVSLHRLCSKHPVIQLTAL